MKDENSNDERLSGTIAHSEPKKESCSVCGHVNFHSPWCWQKSELEQLLTKRD